MLYIKLHQIKQDERSSLIRWWRVFIKFHSFIDVIKTRQDKKAIKFIKREVIGKLWVNKVIITCNNMITYCIYYHHHHYNSFYTSVAHKASSLLFHLLRSLAKPLLDHPNWFLSLSTFLHHASFGLVKDIHIWSTRRFCPAHTILVSVQLR